MIRKLLKLWMRILGTVRNESRDSEFQTEIEEHVRLLTERYRGQGMTMEAAKAELQGLGLVVDVIVLPGTTGDQVVLQSPDPGTTVHAGDTVKIYVTGP